MMIPIDLTLVGIAVLSLLHPEKAAVPRIRISDSDYDADVEVPMVARLVGNVMDGNDRHSKKA